MLYAFSEHVVPRPPDWPEDVVVTGYWFHDSDQSWRPPPSLAEFIDGGAPPVYIGFGSMFTRRAEEITKIVLKTVGRTGQRAVISTGWGGLRPENPPDDVHVVDGVPHDWLFPRMAAVVHHGGAGTTAAGLRAGKPSGSAPSSRTSSSGVAVSTTSVLGRSPCRRRSSQRSASRPPSTVP